MIDLHYRGIGHLRQQVECVALLMQRTLASIIGGPLPVLGVTFRHPRPRRLGSIGGCSPWSRRSASPRRPGAARELLGRPLGSASPRVFEVLLQEAALEQLVENQLLERVRYWLALHMERGECTLAACAAALGLGRSALQRSLAEQGSSFRALHDEARACARGSCWPRGRAFARWPGPAASPSCRPSTAPSAVGKGHSAGLGRDA